VLHDDCAFGVEEFLALGCFVLEIETFDHDQLNMTGQRRT
jgi:hypothetical protein